MSKPTLTKDDFCRAAKRIGCEVPAIRAVDDTESKGAGFYADGFPTILFERHIFRKYTLGKYTDTHPEISGPAGNYGAAGQHQRDKFALAFSLDPDAAMKACSWGRYQIMGFNYAVCGYGTVGAFVDAMKESEGRQLDAFVGFVMSNHLADELRNHDWAGFAHGYNGAGYKANRYDTKLATAYRRFAKEEVDCSTSSTVRRTPDATVDDTSDDPNVPPSIDSAADSPERTDGTASDEHAAGDSTDGSPRSSQEQPPITTETTSTTVETPRGIATATTTTQTTAEPVTVKSVAMSLWAKVVAGITVLAGLGINAGTVVENKLSEITLNQVIIAGMGVGLIIVAVWYVQKRQAAADAKTHALIDAAADKDRHTVQLTR